MTKPQRIAIASPSLNDTAGGVETFCSILAQVLRNQGHEVRIFAPEPPTSRLLAKFGLSHLEQAFSMRRIFRSWDAQIVISNGSLGFFGSNSWKHIHVFHGTMVAHSMADRPGRSFRDWLIKGVLGGGISEALSGLGATRVAVSQACAREVRRYYLSPIRQVIPNGVQVESQIDQARAGLIFVGRRESRKGYELAVKLALDANEILEVAGPGSDPRTQNLGILKKDELRELYTRSVAMVFPSNYEACSFAILEALSNGCAVVTTAVGWIPELLSAVPEYKLLVGERNDIASFQLALDRVLSGDPATISALQKAVEWTRLNNSLERFSETWTALIAEEAD